MTFPLQSDLLVKNPLAPPETGDKFHFILERNLYLCLILLYEWMILMCIFQLRQIAICNLMGWEKFQY